MQNVEKVQCPCPVCALPVVVAPEVHGCICVHCNARLSVQRDPMLGAVSLAVRQDKPVPFEELSMPAEGEKLLRDLSTGLEQERKVRSLRLLTVMDGVMLVQVLLLIGASLWLERYQLTNSDFAALKRAAVFAMQVLAALLAASRIIARLAAVWNSAGKR